jgi:hypothetical protein
MLYKEISMRKVLMTAAVVLISGGANAGSLVRESADSFKFDGSEFSTDTTAANFPLSPQGALFFTKTVTPAVDSNALFISLYGTGDEHGGASSWFSCQINGFPCRLGLAPAGSSAPKGWVSLHHLPAAATTVVTNCNNGGGGGGDCHDNGLAYEWCMPIKSPSGPLTVDLRLATSIAGSPVSVERGHIYIDSANIVSTSNRCARAITPATTAAASEESDSLALALKARAKKGDNVAASTNHQ